MSDVDDPGRRWAREHMRRAPHHMMIVGPDDLWCCITCEEEEEEAWQTWDPRDPRPVHTVVTGDML